jgi:hypothetical protein
VVTNIIQNANLDINPGECGGLMLGKLLMVVSGSFYFPMRDLYLSRRQSAGQFPMTTAEDYARYVVPQTMRARPRLWLWRGSFAFIAWILVRAFSSNSHIFISAEPYYMEYRASCQLDSRCVFGGRHVSYQDHQLNHAAQDGVISRRYGLDMFRKRVAEASATDEAQSSLNRTPIS